MNDPKTVFEPLAGYALDLLEKVRNRPFVPHSLTKLHNLKFCRDVTNARTVIEIGSFKGVTARRLSYLFDEVITVEIDRGLYEVAKKRCCKRNNVQLILGDGKEVLGNLMPCMMGKTTILFLDGHFSGGQTGRGTAVEPVLEELDIVADYIESCAGVVIDDFRLFGVEKGWPTKSAVLEKLERVLPCPEWAHYVLNDQYVCVKINGAKC